MSHFLARRAGAAAPALQFIAQTLAGLSLWLLTLAVSSAAHAELASLGALLPVSEGTRALNILAHQDDDIGIMPALSEVLADGGSVLTVYLTAGDAAFGCQSYVVGRERGIKQAYERLAGLAPGGDHWQPDQLLQLGEKQLRLVAMRTRPIALLFVGIANSPLFSANALLRLWTGEVTQVSTFPDTRVGTPPGASDRYTRAQLLDTLGELITAYQPTQLSLLDSTGVWPASVPFEHPEHVASGLFGLAALQQVGGARPFRIYRGYNVQFEPANESAADLLLKQQTFDAYWPHDRKICRTFLTDVCPTGPRHNLQLCDDPVGTYGSLWTRDYSITSVRGRSGRVRGPSGLCFDAGLAAAGSALTLSTCDANRTAQRLALELDGTIRLDGTWLCITRQSALVLEPCTGTLDQQFTLTSDGKLRGPDASCMRDTASTLSLTSCSADTNQRGFALLE